MKDCAEPKKWIGNDYYFNKAIDKVNDALIGYTYEIFKFNDHITNRQAKDEFWERIAEYNGFKIDFNRDKNEPL